MRQFAKRQRMGNVFRWLAFGSLCLVTVIGLVGIGASLMGLYEGEDPVLTRYLYGIFVIDAVGGAVGLVFCEQRFRRARGPVYRRYAGLSEAEQEDIEADLARAGAFTGGIISGTNWLYYYDKFRYLQMLRHDDIAWGYLQHKKRPLKAEEEAHSPGGLATLRLHVVLFLKNGDRIDLPPGPRARAVMQTLRERLPHIPFGYSEVMAQGPGAQAAPPYWTRTRIVMALICLALWAFLAAMFFYLQTAEACAGAI